MQINFGFDAVIKEGEHYFISYSRADINRIAPIAKNMHSESYNMCGRYLPFWYDCSGLTFGELWEKEITRTIKSSKSVIFFLTSNMFTKKDTYMRTEFELAKRFGKPVLCVWLDNTDFNKVSDNLKPWFVELKKLHSLECEFTETNNSIAKRVIAAITQLKSPQPVKNIWEKYQKEITGTAIVIVGILLVLLIFPALNTNGTQPPDDTSSVTDSSDSNDSWYDFTEDNNNNTYDTYDSNHTKLDVPSVGSTVVFGTYQYESIPWLVLTKQNGKALLISKYGLETIPYNSTKKLVNWNNCTLCDWMNNTFYNDAFSSEEQAYITYGNSVDQKIFALNRNEAEKYFSSANNRRTVATDHAKSQGTYVNAGGYSPWWLRVEGKTQNLVTAVDVDGDIDSDYADYLEISGSKGVTLDTVTARPAMWVICD